MSIYNPNTRLAQGKSETIYMQGHEAPNEALLDEHKLANLKDLANHITDLSIHTTPETFQFYNERLRSELEALLDGVCAPIQIEVLVHEVGNIFGGIRLSLEALGDGIEESFDENEVDGEQTEDAINFARETLEESKYLMQIFFEYLPGRLFEKNPSLTEIFEKLKRDHPTVCIEFPEELKSGDWDISSKDFLKGADLLTALKEMITNSTIKAGAPNVWIIFQPDFPGKKLRIVVMDNGNGVSNNKDTAWINLSAKSTGFGTKFITNILKPISYSLYDNLKHGIDNPFDGYKVKGATVILKLYLYYQNIR